jgi:hypothetical protein
VKNARSVVVITEPAPLKSNRNRMIRQMALAGTLPAVSRPAIFQRTVPENP